MGVRDHGPTSGEASPTHRFAQAGTYRVTLTVTDALGNAASDIVTVTVRSSVSGVLDTPILGIPLWTIIVLLVVLVVVVAIYRWARKPPKGQG